MTVPQDLRSFNPLPKVYRQGLVSVEAPGFDRVQGETIPRRNAKCKDKLLTTPLEGINTMPDILKHAASKYGDKNAVATRRLVKHHEEVKQVKKMVDGKEQLVEKKWTYFEMSGYTYLTFKELETLALNFGAGLRKLGCAPGDKLHLFAATHAYWLGMAHGAMSQSMPIVTAYDTLGPEGLKHSMAQTHAKAIYLDPSLLTQLIAPLKEVKAIQHVIYSSGADVDKADIDKLKEAHPHLTVMSTDELAKLGKENPVETVFPKPDDLCCIMYTSGSTGTPKGVVLKHSNVVASVAGIDLIVGSFVGPKDSLLAYLPLAHILEFVFENCVMFWGGALGYGNPKTLSDANVRNCKGDIREFRPTILVGVPAVWETVKKGIINKVNAGSPIVRNLFWGAMAAKDFLVTKNLPGTGILDAVVFNKLKEATGGRLRICLSGGGPISKDTQRFISMAICPMIIGYGLTETSACGAIMDPLVWSDTALGEMPGCVEMKLVDYLDAGYSTSNNPPQGEIWIRGNSVTSGYLDLEKETKESFTNDGWFMSGDIGEWDEKGQIRIIDRKKNLVKTLNGEYIALEKLESIYRTATVVLNICVYADINKTKPVAIVVPVEPALKKMAEENGIPGDDVEELIFNGKIKSLVHKQLLEAGKKGGLRGIELVEGVVLAEEEWTPQNGFVTNAQKINRREIISKYQSDIDTAYAKAGS